MCRSEYMSSSWTPASRRKLDGLTRSSSSSTRANRSSTPYRELIGFNVVGCQSVVDSVAKARKLFREFGNEGLPDVVKEIIERTNAAKALRADSDTGQEIAPAEPRPLYIPEKLT